MFGDVVADAARRTRDRLWPANFLDETARGVVQGLRRPSQAKNVTIDQEQVDRGRVQLLTACLDQLDRPDTGDHSCLLCVRRRCRCLWSKGQVDRKRFDIRQVRHPDTHMSIFAVNFSISVASEIDFPFKRHYRG